MAIFHLHVKNISRGDGRSAVAAAAYRAGETLPNEAEERESNFGGRRSVIHAEILAPAEAPAWMRDRAALWNGAEAMERRKDARLAKEIECSLPRELARGDWIALARDLAAPYVATGLVADLAIHEDGRGVNPHLHLMLTTRPASPAGFSAKKAREADGKAFVTDARARWAQLVNAALAKAGAGGRIDARSHAARGIIQEPGRHQGPDPAARRENRELAAMTRDSDPTAGGAAADPVPDPDGRPISPQELAQAEDAMLREMEALAPPAPDQDSPAGLAAARQDIEQLEQTPIRREDADSYRLPDQENVQARREQRQNQLPPGGERRATLQWLRDREGRGAPADGPASPRAASASLDWLRARQDQGAPAPEPEREEDRDQERGLDR